MQNVIGVRTLRRQVNESLLRVARGETIVIARHGRPVAIMRPITDGDTGRRVSVTTFRRGTRPLGPPEGGDERVGDLGDQRLAEGVVGQDARELDDRPGFRA
jgi:prevent-host-death family protein